LRTDGHIEANWGIVAAFYSQRADRVEEDWTAYHLCFHHMQPSDFSRPVPSCNNHILHCRHILTLDGGQWSATLPGRFTLREGSSDTNWIGDWMRPRDVRDTGGERNHFSCQELDPDSPITQSIAFSL
jgi:hypothetical protein